MSASEDLRNFFDLSQDSPWLNAGAPHAGPGAPFSQSPIFAGTYHLSGDTAGVADTYGRHDNPTWRALEDCLGALEGGEAVVFPSGMAAACAAILPFVKAGETVLLPSDGYYTVRMLLEDFLAPLGVSARYYETARIDDVDFADVRLVWIESPTNPQLDMCDIAKVVPRAHAAGAMVVCDNTTMTPLGQRCLALGADLVMASDTKAVNGHSDTLMGHVAGRDAETMARVRGWRKIGGAIPGPMESWLVLRGLQTLEVRFQRMCENARAVAELGAEHEAISTVRYPGLKGDPSYELAHQGLSLMGSMVTFIFAGDAQAKGFLKHLSLVHEATSFGGTHSMAEQRVRWDKTNHPGLVRFSAGCEPTESLVADVRRALDAVV